MSERERYEPGVPCWVDILRPDPEAAMAFYGPLLGWEFAGPGPGGYHVARVRGRDVAGIGTGTPAAPGWTTYVAVESADAAAAAAEHAGGSVLTAPLDVAPAGRLAVLTDPAGAPFGAWEAGDRQGAQRVNEPGAWAISQLATPGADGAEAFYGTLFGWTTEAFGPAFRLFRLPGYVGGEPEQPVSREVVAVMVTGEGPPAWTPDFWVDDVDATSARAAELGGTAVVAPFDTPVGRAAVLADAAGAAFSVSRVTP